MATDPRTVAFLMEQLAALDSARARPMFGEYGLSCDGKPVGVICDDRLFVKPTPAGRSWAGEVTDEPPYRGARPAMVIVADRWDDAEWLCELIRLTADALPVPKPRARKGR